MSKRYSFEKENTPDTEAWKKPDKGDWSSWSRKHEDLIQGLLAWEFSGKNPAYPQNQFLADMQFRVQNQRTLTKPQADKAAEALEDWLRNLTRIQKPDPDAPPHWVPEEDREIWELAKAFRDAEKRNLDYNHSPSSIYVKLEPLARDFRGWFQRNFPDDKTMKIAHGKCRPEKKKYGWKKSGDWADVFRHVIGFYFWRVPYGSPLTLDDFCEKDVFRDTLSGLRQEGRNRSGLQKIYEAREGREES